MHLKETRAEFLLFEETNMAAFHKDKVNLTLRSGYTMHDGLTCVLSQGISPSLSRLRMILSTFSPSSSPRLRATANCPSCAMLLPTVGSSSYYDFQQIITALLLFTTKSRLHKPLWRGPGNKADLQFVNFAFLKQTMWRTKKMFVKCVLRKWSLQLVDNLSNFSGAHIRQLLKFSSKCKDHSFNSDHVM